ncbi:hypothetical protein ACN4EG_15360 [Alkalinema pantanalense CENA528]|uniref:hypothetical protein n=1 Tax=Alkalinema pantanalense TaxID=1620705 RepID=UPI003D6E9CF9
MAGQETTWDFLLQQEGDRSWLPLESPDVEILEGRYRVLVRSTFKNADIELRITHEATEEDPPKRRTQRRHSRTNADGLMVVMPFTMLQPGVWELHCSSGLMTDLIGASCQYSVQLHVLPKESEIGGEWEPDWAQPAAVAEPVQSEIEDSSPVADLSNARPGMDEEAALFAELGLPEVDDPIGDVVPEDAAFGGTIDQVLDYDSEIIADQPTLAANLEAELDLETFDLDDLAGESGLEPDIADIAADIADNIAIDVPTDVSSDRSVDVSTNALADGVADVKSSSEPSLDSLLDELEFAPLEEISVLERSTTATAEGESQLGALPTDADLGLDLKDFPLDNDDVWAAPIAEDPQERAAIAAIPENSAVVGSAGLSEMGLSEMGLSEMGLSEMGSELPPVEVILHPDTYEISVGQSLQLAGQVTTEPLMTSERSETTALMNLDAQVVLRDPQTGEMVVNWEDALPVETLPQDFLLVVAMPTPLAAQLLLGELVLRDRLSQTTLATQSFTVTAALEDLLASIATEITPDLLEPTIEPEPTGPDLDLAFLGLVNQGPTVPDFTASPGQTLPPQLKQPSDHESSERKAIELPPLPQPVQPATETEEADELLGLFDDDLSIDDLQLEDFDEDLLGGLATEEAGSDRDILRAESPSVELIPPPPEFFAEFDREPTGLEGLPGEDLDQLLTEDLFQPDVTGRGAASDDLRSDAVEDMAFDNPFADSLVDSLVEPDELFSGTFQGWEDAEDAPHLDGFDSLDALDAFEEANTIEVTAARLPDEFEALNLDDRFMDRLASFAEETRAEDAAATPPEPAGPINPFVTPSLGNPEAVSESVVMDELPIFAVPSTGTDTPENPLKLPEDEAVPVPQLEVEVVTEVVAGQPLLVKVKLPNLLPKLYVKLWINDRQTRTLLDGPRYLVDFVPNAQGELEATTQLTVPLGSLEIQLEAITIETATKRESYKTSASLPVVPPNLPDVSFDDFGF